MSLLIGCVLLLVALVSAEDTKVVSTEQGLVRGHLKDGKYYAFEGIPYATAPTKEDKFKAPLQPPTWPDIFDASNNRTVCHQHHTSLLSLAIEEFPKEDCLVLNVLVPRTDREDLPVMAYSHSGNFMSGVRDMARHTALLDYGVIVVTFNYRLGVYGFLCLGTTDVPGNAGMKDQVAALRWIKKNIGAFGGSPNDVTLAGYSTGGAGAELLMLSPMAKGLFNKVILESGSALSNWAVNPDPIKTAQEYIEDVLQIQVEMKDMEDFFKHAATELLVEKTNSFRQAFAPCIEQEIEGVESFLTESPISIMKRGDYDKIPILTGFSREEGLYRMNKFNDWWTEMKENFQNFLPDDLVFDDEEQKNKVSDEIKALYFENGIVSNETVKEYVEYFTDVTTAYSMLKSAKIHADNNLPVYLYVFSYVISMLYSYENIVKGATHCAQTALLHEFRFVRNDYSKDDTCVQKQLALWWTNFAKHGAPVPVKVVNSPYWYPLESESMNYMLIDKEATEQEMSMTKMSVWDEVYSKHYQEPKSPRRPLLRLRGEL